MLNALKLSIALCAGMIFSGSVGAGDAEDQLADKVLVAYGGEKLASLKSLILRDQYKLVATNDRRPGESYVSRLHSTLTVDFERDRKAVKNWTVNRSGKRLDQIMFDGEKGWSINFLRGSHVLRPDLNQNNVGSGMMRLLDTTIALALHKSRKTIKLLEEDEIDLETYQKVAFKVGGATDVTVWVHQASGLIGRLVRGRTKYSYSEYRKIGDITYASSTDMYAGGKPSLLTLSRKIEINPEIETAFDLPENTKELEGMQDTTEMTVNQVSEGVFLVGKGFSSSMFVDAGDHYIGAGGMGDFKERLDALNEHIGTQKNVKFQVLPEFQGHLGGINELVEHGVTFVTVREHVAPLKERIKGEMAGNRFLLVKDRHVFDGGKAEVYVIETVLSEQYLLFYVPSAKLVFTVDEFGTQLLNSVPSANKNTLSFRKAIEGLGLDVEAIGYSHGPSVLTMEQLISVTDSYKPGHCPSGHEICEY